MTKYTFTKDTPNAGVGTYKKEELQRIYSLREIDFFILRELGILVEVKEEVWPQKRDMFWYVGDGGAVYSTPFYPDDEYDIFRRDTGNMFRTEKEAEKHREKLLTLGK